MRLLKKVIAFLVLYGGLSEWFMVPALKAGGEKSPVGSNPTPSAILKVVYESPLSSNWLERLTCEYKCSYSLIGKTGDL